MPDKTAVSAKPPRAAVSRETSPRFPSSDTSSHDNVSRETERLPRAGEARSIVIANQKGGVGKTTTAVNIAAALAEGGLSVVLIDLDPQGNASTALGVPHDQGVRGTYDALVDKRHIDQMLQTSPESPQLRVLAATMDLAGAEIELVGMKKRESRLKRAIADFLASTDVDFVIIDCPPSLGLLTVNALVAADEILVPIQCEYYALEGVRQLMRTVDLVKGGLNDDLSLGGVLLTMYDGRTKLAAQVAEEVRNYFPAETFNTVIPRSVRVSEAPSYGATVMSYDPASAGAVAYRAAARELAVRAAELGDPRLQRV